MYILYAWTARKSTLNLSTAALGCPFWETCYRAEIDAKASRRHGPKKLSLAHWRPAGAPFCPGRVLDKTWTEPGQDLFMSWTRPGHALDKTWTEAVRQDFDVAFLPQCTDLGRFSLHFCHNAPIWGEKLARFLIFGVGTVLEGGQGLVTDTNRLAVLDKTWTRPVHRPVQPCSPTCSG